MVPKTFGVISSVERPGSVESMPVPGPAILFLVIRLRRCRSQEESFLVDRFAELREGIVNTPARLPATRRRHVLTKDVTLRQQSHVPVAG